MDLYFENINLYFPLLHRPSFTRFINEGLHLRDELFGANVLLVCATGSRFSNDPRVLLDGESSRHSSGWKWFDQVQIAKKGFLNPPTLYDLQFYSVSDIHFSPTVSSEGVIAFGSILARIICSTSMLVDGGYRN